MSEHRNPGDVVRHAGPPPWWLQEIDAKIEAARDAHNLERLVKLALLLLAVLRLLEARDD